MLATAVVVLRGGCNASLLLVSAAVKFMSVLALLCYHMYRNSVLYFHRLIMEHDDFVGSYDPAEDALTFQ